MLYIYLIFSYCLSLNEYASIPSATVLVSKYFLHDSVAMIEICVKCFVSDSGPGFYIFI